MRPHGTDRSGLQENIGGNKPIATCTMNVLFNSTYAAKETRNVRKKWRVTGIQSWLG